MYMYRVSHEINTIFLNVRVLRMSSASQPERWSSSEVRQQIRLYLLPGGSWVNRACLGSFRPCPHINEYFCKPSFGRKKKKKEETNLHPDMCFRTVLEKIPIHTTLLKMHISCLFNVHWVCGKRIVTHTLRSHYSMKLQTLIEMCLKKPKMHREGFVLWENQELVDMLIPRNPQTINQLHLGSSDVDRGECFCLLSSKINKEFLGFVDTEQ